MSVRTSVGSVLFSDDDNGDDNDDEIQHGPRESQALFKNDITKKIDCK